MKRRIRKIISFSFWLAAGMGVLVLLVAAIKAQRTKICSGYAIDIDGLGEQWFISRQEIAGMIRVNGVIKGRSLYRFNLQEMETELEKNPWIKNAELFFDNNQVLQVRIKERLPVARIFTVGGNSFYVDSSGERLPLSEKFSARLPVFTGFPELLRKRDSALMKHTVQVSEYLLHHPFWMAQIAQVNISGNSHFEMIPVVGNHIIEFGDGERCEDKFRKLMLFYKKVLSKTGMDFYKKIDVQYNRQVVAVRSQE